MKNQECRMTLFWRAVLVQPQARRVLETQLRKLAPGADRFFIQHSTFFIPVYWCGCREPHPDILPGKEISCC